MPVIEAVETFHPVSSGEKHVVDEFGRSSMVQVIGNDGCTMRDYFASKAMSSLIMRNPMVNFNEHEIKIDLSNLSYDIAEYMIDEKRKRDAMDKEEKVIRFDELNVSQMFVQVIGGVKQKQVMFKIGENEAGFVTENWKPFFMQKDDRVVYIGESK